MIITADTWFGITWERKKLILRKKLARHGLDEQGVDEGSPPLRAFVNHGRWLIQCECRGAEYAWEKGVFMCQSCWNGNHRHQYRRSEFPANRAGIEELLERRPLANRNWSPRESIEDLQRENAEHGEELL